MIPELFRKNIEDLLGEENDIFFHTLAEKPPVSIRLNAGKNYTLYTSSEKTPWCATGFYLNERPVFTLDPLFHAGCYYVQEASSMFLEQIIKQLSLENKEVHILDLCAAPGGKTTHLLSLLNKKSVVVSNEVIRSRINVLKENIIKWGYANCFVTNNEAKDFAVLQNYFDVIVCDAPCSGEGLFRKDKEAVNHWSMEAVEHCSLRQKKIIADVMPALKPGGYIIYSTCTYNKTENESIVKWLNKEFDLRNVEIDISQLSGIVKLGTTLRFYPHKIKGEGFTVSVFQKGEEEFAAIKNLKPDKNLKIQGAENILRESENFVMVREGNTESFYHPHQINDYILLKKYLNLVHSGITAFEIKGSNKIPLHSLAVNIHLHPECFQKINLSKAEALNYLKGETNFSYAVPEGFYLAAFENVPLGFLKKIKSRFNNLYPRNWFIRMEIPRLS